MSGCSSFGLFAGACNGIFLAGQLGRFHYTNGFQELDLFPGLLACCLVPGRLFVCFQTACGNFCLLIEGCGFQTCLFPNFGDDTVLFLLCFCYSLCLLPCGFGFSACVFLCCLDFFACTFARLLFTRVCLGGCGLLRRPRLPERCPTPPARQSEHAVLMNDKSTSHFRLRRS